MTEKEHDSSVGAFFGSFGDERGVFFEVHQNTNETILEFGVRRHRQTFWSKIKEVANVFLGLETTFHLVLDDSGISQLKNILRNLK